MSRIYNILLCLVATLALATSCNTDDAHYARISSGEVEVNIATDLSTALGTRTLGDGNTVDEVAWAIYENGALATDIPVYNGTLKLVDRHAAFTVRLMLGHTYDLAFFAYKADGEAIEQAKRAANAKHYNVLFDQKRLTLKTENLKANDEELDCFWLVKQGWTIYGPIDKDKVFSFTLTRPTAQLNFAIDNAEVQGALSSGFSISDTELTAKVYTAFDLFEGLVVSDSIAEVKFARSQSPIDTADGTVTAYYSDGTAIELRRLSSTYMFANAQNLSSSITLSTWDQQSAYLHTVSCDTAPIRRNSRTFLVGNMLTNEAKFNIIIEENYDNPENNKFYPEQ